MPLIFGGTSFFLEALCAVAGSCKKHGTTLYNLQEPEELPPYIPLNISDI